MYVFSGLKIPKKLRNMYQKAIKIRIFAKILFLHIILYIFAVKFLLGKKFLSHIVEIFKNVHIFDKNI